MKGIASVFALALVSALLVQGCSCGGPSPQPDAGVCAGPSPCGACPPGCTSADTCDATSGWQCGCSCTVDAANVCDEYAKRACDFFVRCHAEPSLFFDATEGRGPELPTPSNNQVAASERARCEARLSRSKECTMLLESFRAGRARFDPVGYSACVAALYPTDTCGRDLNVVQERCLKTDFGARATPQGGTCTSDRECVGGWCNATGAGTCGTCQPYVPVGGGGCTRSAQCDPATSYCSSSAGGCVPYRAAGQSCSLFELTSCGPERQCVVGFFGFSGTCQEGKAEGQPCTLNRYECKRSGRALPELLCAPQQTGEGMRNLCVKLQSGPGGRCGDGEVILPDPSDPGGGIRGPLCPETHYCGGNTCVPKKPAASACAADEECAAGLRCLDVGGARACQPFADTGAECVGTEDCKNLLTCAGSQCAPRFALNGEGCPAGVTCAEGYCEAAAPSPTCAAYKPTGAACGADAECRSDVCGTTCQRACWAAP